MATSAYRKRWLRWKKTYERDAFRLIQRNFKRLAQRIDYDGINASNIKETIAFHIDSKDTEQILRDLYITTGLKHGKRVGSDINKQINSKDFTFGEFSDQYINTINNFFSGFKAQNVKTIHNSYLEWLANLIQTTFDDPKISRSQLASIIEGKIRSREFYRWQAMRIARTETSTASNLSAQTASGVSGVQMEKVWISSGDGRTRRQPDDKYDHYVMDGVAVDLNDPFDVQGDRLMFPAHQQGMIMQSDQGVVNGGDPANVINCRCTMAQRVKRDPDGNPIRIGQQQQRDAIQVRQEPKKPQPVDRFIPAKTIREANKFAIDNLGMDFADYRGLDLRVANETNEMYHTMRKLMPNIATRGVGSAQKANKAMKEEVKAFYRRGRLYNMHRENYGERTAERWLTRQANNAVGKLGQYTMAHSKPARKIYTNDVSGKRITLDLGKYKGVYWNEKYGKSADNVDDVVRRNTESKWFYKGGEGARSIIAHEMGHEIDDTLLFRDLPKFWDLYNSEHAKGRQYLIDALSEYGATAGGKKAHLRHEMIAEGWAEFVTTQRPRPLADSIGRMMMESYYRKFINPSGDGFYDWFEATIKIIRS